MNALLSSPSDVHDELERMLADSPARLLLASSHLNTTDGGERDAAFAGICEMEPAGIEPATSCLQRARDPDQLTVGWRFRP
jgi:hypothetical protein